MGNQFTTKKPKLSRFLLLAVWFFTVLWAEANFSLAQGNYGAYSAAASRQEKPNIILVYCDNLGYGDIEPFGSRVNRTPFLNRMAEEGRMFTHFYVTAGVCTPSRASIMTGCYAQRVGMHNNPRDGIVLRPISPYGLHPDEVTLAEVLEKQGYQTALIGKWHLGDQKQFLPTAQGYQYFYGIPYSDDMTQETGQRLGERLDGSKWPPLPLMVNGKVVEAGTDRNLLTKKYTEATLEYITENKDRPFFLFLSQAMPGSTTQPFASAAFRGKSKGGPWGDSVEELDWSVGQIMEKLKELGIEKKTLLIFTSDNGAPMTEDSASVERGTNKPLHGRGYTTAEGAFRVPTIMWWPGSIPPGTVCTEMASTMDFLPTFAEMSGGAAPDDRIIDGHNILPLILGSPSAKSPYPVFYYYYSDQLQALRWGPWKLFVPLKEFSRHPHFTEGNSSKPLLFDVVKDTASARNLAEAFPEVVDKMMDLAGEAKKDLGDLGRAGANQREPGKIEDPVPVTAERFHK